MLELGCGWGSLTLWMAEHFPASDITAVSNSASQREFILARAAERDLNNVTVITADANTPHQAVITAMDAAGQEGFSHLSLTTQKPTEK